MKFHKAILILMLLLFNACSPTHLMVQEQLQVTHSGKVLSVQGYVVKSDVSASDLKQKWEQLAKVMKKKPGFISCYLSPAIGKSPIWLAHSEWESLDAIRNAFSDPLVLKLEADMPSKFDHFFSLGQNGQFPNNVSTSVSEQNPLNHHVYAFNY
jgi:hypothetical protein